MANHETKTITIYQKSYQLPILESDSFDKIQDQIKQRQQVTKNQHREKEVVRYQKRQKNRNLLNAYNIFNKSIMDNK